MSLPFLCNATPKKNANFSFEYSIADFCNVEYLFRDLCTSSCADIDFLMISYVAQSVSYLLVVKGYMEKLKGSKKN